MSYTKRWADDVKDVQEQAVRGRELPTARERLVALRELFEECGYLARVYPCPCRAAAELVSVAAAAWQESAPDEPAVTAA
ncbi:MULTISPECIES: hypothetical protein [Streptomycetaceae]|uniref:Uncharacterized protein n=1 Tax=Streptantibioticus cattleyicolor (strain ATCC 35852 / DSM 46488 / JCM 4925 / NBRC 14057 / NRRL 8057) TaxID=1003195 RepID=F8JYU5_STREN|nr:MULTISPECIES: hypothetical protein [Streptomycetaceae]AEW94065.1 hypothetical protein SCATT_16940 [Streptantibioticus cattleyicolor NRRL 8057 = DSM 46488]MYS58738.1 hypothetical protein [Streptomyces sp. SID5468]CCB74416.1 protein of unknown function [Streptantibioticus cattleyicolor NRRL 8057 = DSM 46488]